jgi:hypothetical protein
MSEKFEKSGGTTEEKQCIEKPFDSPFVVTKIELRGFAEMMAAMARAAGVYEINPEPQKRIIHFRVCDLKIVDDVRAVPDGTGGYVNKVVGCRMTPTDLTRGQWYCLCNDTDDRMHVKFKSGEISPDDFYINRGATVAIFVSGDKIIKNKELNPVWYEYEIWRANARPETLCSGDSGPGMKVEDPPPG